MTIKDIAQLYEVSASTVRQRLRQAESDGKLGDELMARGSGRLPNRYAPELVATAVMECPLPACSEPEALAALPAFQAHERGLIRDLRWVLDSREDEAYTKLIREMCRFGEGLRIRSISGTDFFNKHQPGCRALRRRSRDLDPARVLLLDPRGEAAQVRVAREGAGGEFEVGSQFDRDAESTVSFLRSTSIRFSAKWYDDAPKSLLVWTEHYALVEPYDYGQPPEEDEDDASGEADGFIGRSSPVLVVRPGKYHSLLKDGFDYVFDGKLERTGIATRSLDDVSCGLFGARDSTRRPSR